MKRKIIYLFCGCLLILSLALTACNSSKPGETEPAATTPAPGVTPETPAPGNVDYSALGWTEDEIKMWEEMGTANVESAEAASMLAGFKVVTPGFIPEGLQPVSKYMVYNNAGLRSAGIEPKFEWIDVTLVYGKAAEKSVQLTFIQSNHEFNSGIGEQIEICGRTVEKTTFPTDPENLEPNASLAFGWEDNGIWYYLTGTLGGPLDEETIEKIACSINAD